MLPTSSAVAMAVRIFLAGGEWHVVEELVELMVFLRVSETRSPDAKKDHEGWRERVWFLVVRK
jgi:hypothetical protein